MSYINIYKYIYIYIYIYIYFIRVDDAKTCGQNGNGQEDTQDKVHIIY